MKIVKQGALSCAGAVGFLLAMGFSAAPAHAQATRTWVSGVGDDANPCSRTAPCKTFVGAIVKTAAGGEINCLDPGGFGALTITKSITIRCNYTEGGILATGGNGITVNAGINDRVVLEGLDIDGVGNPSGSGINVVSARDVVVIDCTFRNFSSPTSSGILVNSGAVQARVTVSDSSFIGNTVGITVNSTGGRGNAQVDRSLFTANTEASIRVSGTGNRASVNQSAFYGSPKALELLSGGTASSFGNNAFGTGSTDAPTVRPLG